MNTMAKRVAMVVVAMGAMGSVGCSATTAQSAVRFEPTSTGPIHASSRGVDSVEVLLDRAPERPFKVVGAFGMKTSNNPSSIQAMRVRAAEAGIDGIYWIDCTSPCSGVCTAKGYVYEDRANVASR
ncbi:MAG: hypothetical protein IPM79_02440 [Polyangiaceae bacterium]|nr:hypothetical protein [Polyangiaceae bacterium]MBK8936523.1 hypothetical protein [Polyangiaceae bacterium]